MIIPNYYIYFILNTNLFVKKSYFLSSQMVLNISLGMESFGVMVFGCLLYSWGDDQELLGIYNKIFITEYEKLLKKINT